MEETFVTTKYFTRNGHRRTTDSARLEYFCLEMVFYGLIQTNLQTDGPGVTVKIGESKIGKRIQNCKHHVEDCVWFVWENIVFCQ